MENKTFHPTEVVVYVSELSPGQDLEGPVCHPKTPGLGSKAPGNH